MLKQITESTYWAGLVCAVGAIVWRGLSIVGMMPTGVGTGNRGMGTISLYKAALLFLVIAIASSARSREQK